MAFKRSDCSDFKGGSNYLDIVIGIMGPTGSGKSSFIALLTGDKSIGISHSAEPATSKIGPYNYFDKSGRSVTLVDSPGFDDSHEGLTADDVRRAMAPFSYKQIKQFSGIIYFHRITDPTMGRTTPRNLRRFELLFRIYGPENVVIVTTRWDDVPEKHWEAMEKRENELMKTLDKFFQLGGQFFRHDNTEGSARKIVVTFLDNHAIPLTQIEMCEDKELEETAVGSEIAAELKKLIGKHRKEMKDMAAAFATKDDASRKDSLEGEPRSKISKEMAKWEETRKALADDIPAAREEAKEKQEVADRELLQQGAESNRRVKETEEKAEKERSKLKAEMDNISKERATANKNLDKTQVAVDFTLEELTNIQSLDEIAVKKEQETDRKHRDLVRSMCRQVCYWKSISSALRSALLNPAPIQAGVTHGVSAFVARYRTGESNGPVVTGYLLEGHKLVERSNGNNFWDFQVLVGNPSGLFWTPCRGRFDVKWTTHAVIGWDKDVDNVADTQYIARFLHLGNVFVTCVTESASGVSVNKGGVVLSSQEYEVLCYKEFS